MSTSTLGATAHATENTTKAALPASSTGRRPSESLTGPNRICPSARPTRNVVMDNCTFALSVCGESAIAGNPGTYISVANGATEDSPASTIINSAVRAEPLPPWS
nr:hypothetical protein [Amycolatopsis acididurans]